VQFWSILDANINTFIYQVFDDCEVSIRYSDTIGSFNKVQTGLVYSKGSCFGEMQIQTNGNACLHHNQWAISLISGWFPYLLIYSAAANSRSASTGRARVQNTYLSTLHAGPYVLFYSRPGPPTEWLPKKWHIFWMPYNFVKYWPIFSFFFHCQNHEQICNRTITKDQPHRKCVATPPREMSLSLKTTENETTSVTTHCKRMSDTSNIRWKTYSYFRQ